MSPIVMFRSQSIRLARGTVSKLQARCYSQASTREPRHLMTIADLSPREFAGLVKSARLNKENLRRSGGTKVPSAEFEAETAKMLAGQVVAMMFSKRSTRTRVSTEAAVKMMGGHPMFLGKDDIQLGVNESLYDTSKVISSMTSCMVARVGPHSDVADLAKHSAVPVINALSNDFHPLQAIADFLTLFETYVPGNGSSLAAESLNLEGLKMAWVGDSNNVLFDLAIGCAKMGVDIAVASPEGYGIPSRMKDLIEKAARGAKKPGRLMETTSPSEAVKGADVLVTDTWVSMGQEEETQKRLKAFSGFQITEELAKKGGAKGEWKFMHCLPRHKEEVDDEVFYGDRSLVFPEAENRLWAAVAAFRAFVGKEWH